MTPEEKIRIAGHATDCIIEKCTAVLRMAEDFKKELECLRVVNSGPNDIDTSLNSRCNHVYTELIHFLNYQYEMASSIPTVAFKDRMSNEQSVIKRNADALIKVKVQDNGVYIKIPRLIKKTSKYSSVAFNDMLRLRLEELSGSGTLPHYDAADIRFVHVYDDKHAKSTIPDNDNIDTKKVIDIVTDSIVGNDNALNISLTYQSIQTNQVEEGTYIYITDYSQTRKNTEDFVYKNYAKNTMKKR